MEVQTNYAWLRHRSQLGHNKWEEVDLVNDNICIIVVYVTRAIIIEYSSGLKFQLIWVNGER